MCKQYKLERMEKNFRPDILGSPLWHWWWNFLQPNYSGCISSQTSKFLNSSAFSTSILKYTIIHHLGSWRSNFKLVQWLCCDIMDEKFVLDRNKKTQNNKAWMKRNDDRHSPWSNMHLLFLPCIFQTEIWYVLDIINIVEFPV